jgi:hypothetical protein
MVASMPALRRLEVWKRSLRGRQGRGGVDGGGEEVQGEERERNSLRQVVITGRGWGERGVRDPTISSQLSIRIDQFTRAQGESIAMFPGQ